MALIRNMIVAGEKVCLLGTSYNSSAGGGQVLRALEELNPRAVLMESFAGSIHGAGAEGASQFVSGQSLPYRTILSVKGAQQAFKVLGQPALRKQCTADLITVLAALQRGSDIVLADRLHTASFSRLVHQRSLDTLRHDLIDATEALALHFEHQQQAPRTTSGKKRPTGPRDGNRQGAEEEGAARNSSLGQPMSAAEHLLPPQNIICPFFEELWGERHFLMAHWIQEHLERQQGPVVLVAGSEHVAGVAAQLEASTTLRMDGEDEDGARSRRKARASELLENARYELTQDTGAVELEKRAAVAAFLVSTKAFPPELVLPPFEELMPPQAEVAKAVYPKYRTAFMGRLAEAQAGDQGYQQMVQAMAEGGQPPAGSSAAPRGLHGLEEWCRSLADGAR